VLFLALFSTFAAGSDNEASKPRVAAKPERVYRLESVELIGTTRITVERLVAQLGLEAGVALDDSFVLSTRARLLSLGLFRSAILVMRKGSEKGRVHLVFEVEDDNGVLGPWAMGGSLAVTQPQTLAASTVQEAPPLGYKMDLVGRNFFSALHRGAVSLDIDGKGVARQGSVAYGIPRFAAEQVQFDADISFVDVNQRYLNTLGFGGRGQGIMTRTISLGDLQYGAAMYVNTAQRFRMPGYPALVAGPKIGISRETRLISFVPGSGFGFGASLLVAPVQLDHSVFEVKLARTFAIGFSRLTIGTDAINVGLAGYGVRSEARVDLPFSLFGSASDSLTLFSRFRGGLDIIENTRLSGSAAIFGLRYHSSGFIAEFAIQVTKIKDPLAPLVLSPSSAEGR
jgi:hypothetical protein